LIAHLDGQLDPEREVWIERLLRSSWELRVRLSEINRNIETFVQALPAGLSSGFPRFEEVWRPLQDRLAGSAQVGQPAASRLRIGAGFFQDGESFWPRTGNSSNA
jgi:anti-sigma factor RsiW